MLAKRETDDVGVVKAGEEVNLCPDDDFVSLVVKRSHRMV